MRTAPRKIDGADVVACVMLDSVIHQDSGSLLLSRHGVSQSSFWGLAIATYDLVAFYLFFCDFEWQAENDTVHDSVAEAMEIAERKFGVKASEWNFCIEELKPD